jgi:dolichol-phosphate mannosyltransferase
MAYNEAPSLEATAREIHGVLRALGAPCEMLIVDDGSGDGTGEIADALARELDAPAAVRVRVVHHRPNLGLGGVYRTGFAESRGDYLTFFPADGQFPATIIRDFLPRAREADLVLGYLPDRKSSVVAKALSAVERLLYAALFGRLPRFQGIMMLRRAVLADVALKSAGRGWAVVMELIIRMTRGGYRVVSVPNEMRPRLHGESKVNNVRTIWANVRQVVALREHL